MSIDDNKYIDFSLSQTDTLTLQPVSKVPQAQISIVPRPPRRTRLEQLSPSGTTTGAMRVIRRVRVERLPEYFEQTCDRRPHEIAVICGSSQLTYQELDHRANRLAHFLISRGVGEGSRVGILLERSLDTYAALLAVLKAGAAFVPLDPSFTPGQVAFIAEDAELQDLVTTSAFRDKTGSLPWPVLELDQSYRALSIQHASRPQIRVDPASLCYITYTLGVTVQPKGVAVSHANIVNFLHVATPIYAVTRNDRVYQGMSTAFDFSFEEIWPAWIAGATLVAGPPDHQRSGHRFTRFLIDQKITVLCCVPTQLAAIERDVPSLRCLIIGGEPCPPNLVSRWSRPGRRMLNTYGPAETTVMATCSELFPGRPVTIGFPLPTYSVYILDEQFRLVEDGKRGEICIGGPGVAVGYLNRPDLTDERFVPNPVWRDREMIPRLYRTGDLGRTTPAGEIEYLGRIGTQMHIRGYRTELSTIEQMVLSQANPVPLNENASASQFETRATSSREAKTSRLRILTGLNLKNIYKHVMTDPLYKNSLFNMASTFILSGLGFIFWIIIARLYKAEMVGVATTLISIMTLLSNFTIIGLNGSLNRYLPKSANKNELINSSFVLVAGVTVLATIIFLFGLQLFSPKLLFLQSNLLYGISFVIFMIFCSWNMLVESTFMAFRAASNILVKNTIVSVLKIIIPFAFVAFGAYGIFASTASALAIGVLVSLITLSFIFKVRPSVSVNISLLRETLGYSFANYINGFVSSMPSLVLPVIILNVLSAKYAAYYYIASMIQSVLQIIPLASAQALLTEGSYNESELKKHVKKATATIAVVLIPATVVIVIGGKVLLQLFGKSYASEAFLFLQLYSGSTIFASIISISNAIMNIKHQIKLLIISNVFASLLTLLLSYAFISSKLVGIGWGWMLGQAIAGLISLLLIIRNLCT